MGSRSAAVRQGALGAAAVSSGLVVLHSGPVSLVGWLLAGAVTAGWAYVYARCMCAGQRLDWPRLVQVAVWGALAMTFVAVAAQLAGAGVWLLAGLAVAGWVVLVTPDGHVPARVRDRLRAVQLGAWQLLRGR